MVIVEPLCSCARESAGLDCYLCVAGGARSRADEKKYRNAAIFSQAVAAAENTVAVPLRPAVVGRGARLERAFRFRGQP